MIICTTDNQKMINVGREDILFSLYSTILIKLEYCENKITKALDFFQSGICEAEDAREVAREINVIRDELSKVKPGHAIYNYLEPEKEAPWLHEIPYEVTSCANLYYTADGKDMLFEIMSAMTYASELNVAVLIK